MRACLVLAILALFVSGCGSADTGPPRYRVSGEATFGDQPIPRGDVLFTPDGSKGNSGPQGIASIENGKYDTALGTGQGIAGGPMMVRVTALDEAGTSVLCEFEYAVELPKEDSTHKVEVPATAQKRLPSPEI